MHKIIIFATLVAGILMGCNSTKEIPAVTFEYEETTLDTLTVSAPRKSEEEFTLATYNEEATKSYDILHMDLMIEPEWESETAEGTAILTIKPYFYPINTIRLDAKNMLFRTVKLNGKPCKFEYDVNFLNIQLDRVYQKTEQFDLTIDYIANPSLGRPKRAQYFKNDRGLYFIHKNEKEDKPIQLWTQGETTYNSAWFPTRDHPNERMTHNIKIIVPDSLVSLSNGILKESKKLDQGKRMDHWVMDQEHAPYLAMIAVGDYAIVKDQWENIPLTYYVYPEYEASAKNIFNHTPEMLSFFSDLTGVKYPWQKYAQIVVEDFVAGAMENTTAVTFGEFVQKTNSELIDNHNDYIVAHELFHHWFGNYVTCESWANLTLNEGFANYSEYLWTAHKYGEDAAHNKRFSEWKTYLNQCKYKGVHPLIHFGYSDPNKMFDAHSYNKGGLTLHYLRHLIGEDAFFEGMKTYLSDNAGTSVEVDELRLAYEKTTGLDLKPFFDQWYLASGHPVLDISYSSHNDSLFINVTQAQDPKESKAIFEMPLEWEIHLKDGSTRKETFYTNKRENDFLVLGLTQKDIEWINFDPAHVLIGEYSEDRDSIQYVNEYLNGDQFDKREALNVLRHYEMPRSFYEEILTSETNFQNKLQTLRRIRFTTEDKELISKALLKSDNALLTDKLLVTSLGRSSLVDVETIKKVAASNEKIRIKGLCAIAMIESDEKTFQAFFETLKDINDPQFYDLVFFDLFDTPSEYNYAYLWDKLAFASNNKFATYARDLLNELNSTDEKTLDRAYSGLLSFFKHPAATSWQKKIVKEKYDFYARLSSDEQKVKMDELKKKYKLGKFLD